MDLAHHLIVDQGELFAGRELPAASVARKAGQMEHEIARLPHPVGGGNRAAALGAFGAKHSVWGEGNNEGKIKDQNGCNVLSTIKQNSLDVYECQIQLNNLNTYTFQSYSNQECFKSMMFMISKSSFPFNFCSCEKVVVEYWN